MSVGHVVDQVIGGMDVNKGLGKCCGGGDVSLDNVYPVEPASAFESKRIAGEGADAVAGVQEAWNESTCDISCRAGDEDEFIHGVLR